jgi:hypothetical protein
MKRALILAAEQSVHSRDGTLVSYVTWIANEHPALFCSMLGRMVPMEAKIKSEFNAHDLKLDPGMDLNAMMTAFELKIKSDYRPREIAHDDRDYGDGDDE